MTTHKSIADLNERLWYRLVKVAFVGLFLLITLGLLVSVYSDNQKVVSIDNSKTTVDCHYPTEHTITADEGYIYFTMSDFPNGSYASYGIYGKNQEIDDACGIKSQDLAPYLKTAVDNGAYMTINSKGQKGYALFKVNPAYTSQGGWKDILLYSGLVLVVMVAVAEGLRRIFYYIVLGTFRPKK